MSDPLDLTVALDLQKPGHPVVQVPMYPPYTPAAFGRWRLTARPNAGIQGYFFGLSPVPHNFVLEQRHQTRDKWKVWMSITPMELESHMLPVAEATGYVVVAGLGMGMYLYNIIQKRDVFKVTVLEKDEQVIRLFHKFATPEQWPGWEKVEIIHTDALEWQPKQPVNFLYADIWAEVGSRKALPLTKFIQANVKAEAVAYWTQEFDFIHFCSVRYPKVRWTPDFYQHFVELSGLPLVGRDYPAYPYFAHAAVQRQVLQMKDGKLPPIV